MNIYFHIDELNRDAVVASALKKKFANLGHRLVYGNRVVNRLLKYFHGAFDVIIVPRPHFLYDNWADDWISWDCKIVMLSTESLGIICKDHHVMARTLLEKGYFEGDKVYISRIDAFCFWGNKQIQAVREYASEVAYKCHVVGHPRHDKCCIAPKVIGDAHKNLGKRKVGIITRAVALNDYFDRNAIEGFSVLFDSHFKYEYFNKITGEQLLSKRPQTAPASVIIVQAIDLENTLKIIKALNDAGHEVSIRVHPKERASSWKRLIGDCNLDAEISDEKIPITRWLSGIDYVVGPPSTSFYDAVMLDKTPISISDLDMRRKASVGELWEDNNRLMPHLFTPNSIEELVDFVDKGNRLTVDESIKNVLAEEADYPNCANSLDRLIDVCVGLVKRPRNRVFVYYLYHFVRPLFFHLWHLRSILLKRRSNSAMFVLSRREIAFIDGLTSRN